MREEQKERALLLGVKLNDGEDFKKSMEELAALSEACGMEVVGTLPRIWIGSHMRPCIWAEESWEKCRTICWNIRWMC